MSTSHGTGAWGSMFSSCFAVARVTDRCTRQTDSFRGKRKYDPQFGFFFLECVIIVASMVRKRSCEVCLCCSYGREQCCHSWLVCQRSLCPSISGPGLSPAPETVAGDGRRQTRAGNASGGGRSPQAWVCQCTSQRADAREARFFLRPFRGV